MSDEAPTGSLFSFKLDPSGKDLTVFLKCTGITTGTYSIQFAFPGKSDQFREGNIEKAETHMFPAGGGLTKIGVRVKAVPFLASDPGSYQVIVEQPGGSRLETPAMPYDAEPEIIIESVSA